MRKTGRAPCAFGHFARRPTGTASHIDQGLFLTRRERQRQPETGSVVTMLLSWHRSALLSFYGTDTGSVPNWAPARPVPSVCGVCTYVGSDNPAVLTHEKKWSRTQ